MASESESYESMPPLVSDTDEDEDESKKKERNNNKSKKGSLKSIIGVIEIQRVGTLHYHGALFDVNLNQMQIE